MTSTTTPTPTMTPRALVLTFIQSGLCLAYSGIFVNLATHCTFLEYALWAMCHLIVLFNILDQESWPLWNLGYALVWCTTIFGDDELLFRSLWIILHASACYKLLGDGFQRLQTIWDESSRLLNSAAEQVQGVEDLTESAHNNEIIQDNSTKDISSGNQKVNETLKAQASEAENVAKEKDARIEEQSRLLSEKDARITELDKLLREQTDANTEQSRILSDKAAYITDLEKRLEEQKATNIKYNEITFGHLEAKVKELTDSNHEHIENIRGLRETIQTVNDEKAALDKLKNELVITTKNQFTEIGRLKADHDKLQKQLGEAETSFRSIKKVDGSAERPPVGPAPTTVPPPKGSSPIASNDKSQAATRLADNTQAQKLAHTDELQEKHDLALKAKDDELKDKRDRIAQLTASLKLAQKEKKAAESQLSSDEKAHDQELQEKNMRIGQLEAAVDSAREDKKAAEVLLSRSVEAKKEELAEKDLKIEELEAIVSTAQNTEGDAHFDSSAKLRETQEKLNEEVLKRFSLETQVQKARDDMAELNQDLKDQDAIIEGYRVDTAEKKDLLDEQWSKIDQLQSRLETAQKENEAAESRLSNKIQSSTRMKEAHKAKIENLKKCVAAKEIQERQQEIAELGTTSPNNKKLEQPATSEAIDTGAKAKMKAGQAQAAPPIEEALPDRFESKVLGQDAHSITYEYDSLYFNRQCAKYFTPGLCSTDKNTKVCAKKFKQEAQILESLRDKPHIVQLIENVERPDNGFRPYYTFETLDGNVEDLLREKDGHLDNVTALTMLRQLMLALNELKKVKVIHGNITLKSILYERDEENDSYNFSLAGFDLARIAPGKSDVTTFSGGSKAYLSPEAVYNGAVYLTGSDLWSAYCCFMECRGVLESVEDESPYSDRVNNVVMAWEDDHDRDVMEPLKDMVAYRAENRDQPDDVIRCIDFMLGNPVVAEPGVEDDGEDEDEESEEL